MPAPVSTAVVDPFLLGSFWIEIQGVVVASFVECTGLHIETEVMEYSEGGRNDVVYKLPVRTKYSNITLKRGWTASRDLWNWYQEVVSGTIKPRDCSIVMCENDNLNPSNELNRLNVQQAFPVKWQGPDLKADGTGVAVETLELAHLGFQAG
jgi:phage tail-like protein